MPDQCALLHSKVFQDSAFSDVDSDVLTPTPPDSPKLPAKRLSSAAISLSSRQGLARTGSSLSVTLKAERERERSKSLSVGPARALSREVSMSTGFKPRRPAAPPRAQRAKPDARRAKEKAKEKEKEKTQGVTLVKATPVNRQEKHGGRAMTTSRAAAATRSAAQRSGGMKPLPSMLASSRMAIAVEGDDDDDDWVVDSSPDKDADWDATPTKKPKVKAKQMRFQ